MSGLPRLRLLLDWIQYEGDDIGNDLRITVDVDKMHYDFKPNLKYLGSWNPEPDKSLYDGTLCAFYKSYSQTALIPIDLAIREWDWGGHDWGVSSFNLLLKDLTPGHYWLTHKMYVKEGFFSSAVFEFRFKIIIDGDHKKCVGPMDTTWGLIDIAKWKLLPEKLGGGIPYIQKFKDAWVRHNKMYIKTLASQYRMPSELLAGVCWIEVAGDPDFIDGVAFKVRSFDWSGPDWVDRNLTVTKHPAKTSFGSVSMQLRTAAETLGLNPANMSTQQLRNLAACLEKDAFNIEVAARHLRQLIDHDGLQKDSSSLTMDDVRIVGARYNRGMGLSLEQIKKNTSYGDFIVKFWGRFTNLLL